MPIEVKKPIHWPHSKKFAFTVFDDTDLASVENVSEVYRVLADLGFRTTKSVWPLRGAGNWMEGGATCEDEAYLAWCLELQRQGFEIGYHCSSYQGLAREDIRRALDCFKSHFGHDPRSMANHASPEAIYWGASRLSGWRKSFYRWSRAQASAAEFQGEREGSRFFWGDLCHERVGYVRNFITSDINTLGAIPQMPYRDPEKPWVRAWFGASEGPNVESFMRCISEKNQDRLLKQGGACIMYTHFSCGFQQEGKVLPEFKRLMERLAGLGGWYVPVSELLDYLISQKGLHLLSAGERSGLELRWLAHKIMTKGSS